MQILIAAAGVQTGTLAEACLKIIHDSLLLLGALMILTPLDAIPLWGLFVIATVLALISLEGGYRFGRWRHIHANDEKEGPTGAMVGTILGLLAFMLAFTFSLAASRFDTRRQTVLEESNAISTTYLRARLLPEPHRSEVYRLLREYVDVRIQGIEEDDINKAISRSEELHGQLWSHAAAAAEESPASIMTGLFVQSLNEVIDMHAKRMLVGVRSRIPVSIWVTLLSLAAIGMTAMGYQCGLSATRRSPTMVLMALAFAGVLFLIVDLDRAHQGLLRVSQQAMVDAQKTMQSMKP